MKKLLLFVVTAVSFFLAGIGRVDGTANAATLIDSFNEKHLAFYEEEVAKEKVYSRYDESELTKTALDNGVSVDKLKKLLVYCHAMKNIGKNYTIAQANSLSNLAIVSDAKKYVDYLKSVKSPEEMKRLEERFKEINGK